MKFISAALLALITTSLVCCGAPSKKEKNIDLVKVDNENLPQAIVIRTDSNGETKYFQVFDSELANLTRKSLLKQILKN